MLRLNKVRSRLLNNPKVRSVAKEIVFHILYYVRLKRPGQVRVVIFAQGRTGSTLLEDLLCSSGYFSKNGELLNSKIREVWDPAKYVIGLSRWKNRNFIFHVKVYHLTKDRNYPVDPARFLQSLIEDGWNIIYLRRKNKVKHVLSNLVAEARGDYHKQNDEKEDIRVRVDCERFVDCLQKRQLYDDLERMALGNLPFLEAIYEEDLENSHRHQETANRIWDFLSLSRKKVHTRYRKVNTFHAEELVSNYEELITCLK